MTNPDNLSHINGAQAYLISKGKAREYCEKLLPIKTVSDDWDSHLSSGLILDIKLIYPPFPVLHAELLSIINEGNKTSKNNLRTFLKNCIYFNKIFPFYQLFLWNRRRIAESRQRKYINAPGFMTRKTYKL